jgi:hypothetical protein
MRDFNFSTTRFTGMINSVVGKDMGTDDVKRLHDLEQENNRLEKILAKRDLEIEVMKEIIAKSGVRAGTITIGLSVR